MICKFCQMCKELKNCPRDAMGGMPVPRASLLLLQHVSLNCPWRHMSLNCSLQWVPFYSPCYRDDYLYYLCNGKKVLNTLVGAATVASRRFASAHLPVFSVMYIWVSVLNTCGCQRTSHIVKLTHFMHRYLSKAEAQLTKKPAYLTPHRYKMLFTYILKVHFAIH